MTESQRGNESVVLVKELQRHLDSVTSTRLPVEQARYQYLIERRDKTNDQIRTGLILLNSAALLGVLTALGTDLVSQARFGIQISDLAYSACAFIVGSVFAAVAVMVESWRLPMEAATQFVRRSRQENLRAALDTVLTEESLAECTERMNEVHAVPPADFNYSPIAMWLTNFAGAAWIAGLVLPLFRIGSLIDWELHMPELTGELLAAAGLILTLVGAWITARAVILKKEDALQIGLARYSSGDPEKDAELPMVQNLLSSSRAARRGLLMIAAGTLLQIAPIALRLLLRL